MIVMIRRRFDLAVGLKVIGVMVVVVSMIAGGGQVGQAGMHRRGRLAREQNQNQQPGEWRGKLSV